MNLYGIEHRLFWNSRSTRLAPCPSICRYAGLVVDRHKLMSVYVRRAMSEATHGVAIIRKEEQSVELLRYAEGACHEKGRDMGDDSFNGRENNNKQTSCGMSNAIDYPLSLTETFADGRSMRRPVSPARFILRC